jgi:tetrapyrrole methylase family protein/MazG family protein
MPSLVQAETFQQRAARVGFDWSNIQGVLDKIPEEILEIQNAPNQADRVDEFGDLLFALVNWARWYNIDAESALRSTNRRFRTRFSYIEKMARKQGRSLQDLSLQEMDLLWDAAKDL